MSRETSEPIRRDELLGYFLAGSAPRSSWKVGMELEKMGTDGATGRRIPYDGASPNVGEVLRAIRDRRGGEPVLEGEHLIGLDAPWGSITLEPGGQVEWSSRPAATLAELQISLDRHLETLSAVGSELGVRWIAEAVDPRNPLGEMPWMPKARYAIMREHLGRRGRLAHRMMTQTASIQCAFDYADPEDWRRKFLAAARLSPLATALFANSPRVDGRPTGYRSYRQAIWNETDPDRCGLPAFVFERGFDMERWLDWVLEVPTLFRRRDGTLVPAGAVPFSRLLDGEAGDRPSKDDWETHVSTIFTEVRSYTYIEVRSADLQPDDLCFAVPTFWTGLLYHEDGLDWALRELGRVDHSGWREGMDSAGRRGTEGDYAGRPLDELVAEALSVAVAGLRGGAACVSDPEREVLPLERLARHVGLPIRT